MGSEASLYHLVEFGGVIGKIAATAYAASAREIVKKLDVDSMKWRQHGLGMLQSELSEELRVHIWHPKLRTLPFDGFRDVHDHRFTLTSYVAVGTIIDIPFSVVPLDYGEYGPSGWERHPVAEVHEIVHAKEQENVRAGCSTATLAKSLGPAYVAQQEAMRWKAPSVYAILRRNFHTTRIDDLAITLVHRSDFDGKLARVLGLAKDGDVGSAIVPETLETLCLKNWVLREAHYAIAAMR